MKPFFLLTQLLPLIVFIVVDSFVTDVRISILAAVLFALGQLALTWRRSRRVDWFVLLDVGLIATFGAISIALEDELFFRIKPAIIEGVTMVFMLALLAAPPRFLTNYFGRMMPENTLRPEVLKRMKTLLGWMCLWVALHASAVLYTAFFSTRKVWALVSGPGFYVIFIPILVLVLWKFLRARRGLRAPGM